jgi:hypothetical protein
LGAIAAIDPKSNILRRPMKITGLTAVDEGGVVASFMDEFVQAVFAFGAYANSSSNHIAQYVVMTATETDLIRGDIEKLFAPSPTSMFLEGEDESTLETLWERMRVTGILMGSSLNSLVFSRTLTLSVPLDRVVLQRLIRPNSPID